MVRQRPAGARARIRAVSKRDAWNARYAASDLVWGAEPNRFVAAELGDLAAAGRALDLACGEGRNSIWLATRGWRVTGVDYSDVAIERARKLSGERGVAVDWVCDDVTRYGPDAGDFRLAIVLYLQIPAEERRRALAHAAQALEPGGTLFCVGHARRNLAEGTGGPQDPAVLWEPDEVAAELEALGLVVARAEHVQRPVETQDGCVDALVRTA